MASFASGTPFRSRLPMAFYPNFEMKNMVKDMILKFASSAKTYLQNFKFVKFNLVKFGECRRDGGLNRLVTCVNNTRF